MARDEEVIEAEIIAAGKTAPRVTPQDIDNQIVGEYFGRASEMNWVGHGPQASPHSAVAMSCLTLCVLVLRNGFTVTGESACASPENYDFGIGVKIARENARAKIWALEGYALKKRLAT